MKNILLFILLFLVGSVWGQTEIYRENMYNGSGGTSGDAISTHESNNRFNLDALTYSGTGDMRNTSVSSGYTGVSGTWNVMLNAASETFIMDGINVSLYSSITVDFGIRKATTTSNGSTCVLEYSTTGSSGTYTAISWPALPTGSGTAGWYLRTSTSAIPNTVTTIRFRTTDATEFRIDDIVVSGILVATPSIALSSPSQTAASNINQSSTNNIISHFQAAVTVANATLNSLQFTTAGSHTAGDLTGNFKLFYGTTNVFGSATQIATVASGGPNTRTFTSLTQAINSGSTGYFWITADASGTSGGNRTLTVSANPTLTFASGTPTGTIAVGGTKTFVDPTTPSINVGSITAFGNQCVNTISTERDYSVSGTNLTANIIITTPVGYQISLTSGSGFVSNPSTISLTPSAGTVSPTTIYVRFAPTSAITYSSNISHTSTGAPTQNVAVSGTGINGVTAVTTTATSSITTTEATSGGTGISTTCGTITAKGVVWGTAANPTIPSVNSTNEGAGTTNYTSSITGLNAGTTYNYRAYATNSNGVTSYGSNLTFTTLKFEPSNFPTTFTCGTTTTTTIPLSWTAATGTVLPDGYLIKWSSISYAAITDPVDGNTEADGITTQNVVGTSFTPSGLTQGVTYFFKIWSYSNSGTGIDYKLSGEPQTSCATQTGPCLAETFDASTTPPTGWTYTSITHNTNNPRTGLRSAVFNSDADAMVSPLIANPSSVSFWWRRSGTAPGSPSFIVSVGPSATGPWTQIGSTITSFTTTYDQFFEDISTYSNIYIQVLHNRTSGTNEIYLDDFDVFCSSVCATPTSTTSLTASNATTNGADFTWTGTDGDGTMLVIRATANANLAPTSGTSYTADANFASAGQINTNNRVVFRASGSSVSGITGLNAETQYTATAYNYNNLDDCYQLALPANTSFYTLSLEPSAHAASFTSTAFAFNQIDLTFSAANTLSNADGYIILQRTAAAPTGLPDDANAYSVGNSVGDATVAAIITNSAATTASITGLLGSTQYYFSLIPFNWNNTVGATYNYRTAATIPLTNATTLVEPSSNSDLIASTSYTYNSNINYLNYQIATITNTANSLDLFRFDIRDGGGAADSDALPTILNAITFNVSNINNIRTAALFNVNALVNAAPVINYGAGTITFSGLSGANVTAADGGTNSLTLRVSFQSTVLDNSQIQITISAANTTAAGSSTSSLFSSFTNVISSITGDRNRIEVIADRLAFVQQPTETGLSATMTPAVTIEGIDINANRDLDFAGSIDVTSTGTLTGSPVNAVASAGLATFSGLVHTVAQTARTLTATTTGLAAFNTANSASFDITTVPSNSFRTTSAGTWTSSGGTATWERLISGVWTSNAAPAFSSSNNIYIRHNTSIVGSTSAASIIVENGGTLTNASSCTYGGTLCRVENGGTLQINASVTISGNFIVLDGGTVNINFSFGNPNTSIWNGTEIFHPNSNLVIQNWDFTNDFLIPDNTSISTNTFNGYTAVFGNVIIDAGSNSTNWTMMASGTTINLAHRNLEFISNNANVNIATTGTVTTGIGNDFYVDDLYNPTGVIQFKTSGTMNFTIMGNYNQDAATVRIHAGSAVGASTILNIEGDMNITPSAVVDFNSSVSANTTSTINLKGDLTGSGSGLLQNSNSSLLGNFNFTGTGDGLTSATTQTIDIASTSTNENRNINFNINSGAYVRLANRDFELGANSGVYVQDGAIFDFGFNGTTALNVTISGSQTGTVFQSLQGSTLKITSVDGITTTAGIGNVRTVPSNRSYNQTAIFHYIGKANQVTGNGIGNGSTGKILICEMDNNTLTLTPSNNLACSNATTITTLGGRLEIRKGIFIETPIATVTGTGRLVMTDGTFRTSILTNTLPQLSNYANYSLTGGTVELNGNGSQVISGAPNGGYYNLAITNAGTKTVTSGFGIANNLLISDGIFDPANSGIIGNAGITMTGGRFRMSILNQTLPQLTGVSTPYSLTGGTIELYGTSATQTHSLRGTFGASSTTINYNNIDLNALAANVATGGANVVAGAGFNLQGTMTVNSPVCFQLASGFTIGDAGTSSFILSAGSTLKYGGTIATSGATGNIRTDVRAFPVTASYGFVGSIANQAVGSGLPATMVNLYLDKFSNETVVLAQHTQVTNAASFEKGRLDLNNFNLTLGTSTTDAIISGGSSNSYAITWKTSANGQLLNRVNNTTGTYFFPMGDNTNYTPAEVAFNGGTTTLTPGLSSLTAQMRGESHPNINNATLYLNRFWRIEPSNITTPQYNIWYDYLGSDFSTSESDESLVFPCRFNTQGNGWIFRTGSSGATVVEGSGTTNFATNRMSWSGLSSFSDFTGIGDGTPLPIQLIHFSATPNSSEVVLNWVTSSEINNDYFTVERSADAVSFEEVLKVNGAGNSNIVLNYSDLDRNPINGISYYRLKQTDFNGDYSYSEIVPIQFNNQTFSYWVSTNESGLLVNLNNSQSTIKVDLIDALGKSVFQKQIKGVTPNFQLDIQNNQSIAKGIYYLRIESGSEIVVKKVVM